MGVMLMDGMVLLFKKFDIEQIVFEKMIINWWQLIR